MDSRLSRKSLMRHGAAALLAIACAIGLAGAAARAQDAPAKPFGPSEWTQYRGGPSRNAVFQDGTGGTEVAPAFQTDNQVRATPVIVNGRLYVGDHETGTLNAFDVRTGKKLWQAKAPNWVHSDMIEKDGVIYVGFGNRLYPSMHVRGTGESGVMALSADTGETVWTFRTAGTGMPTPALKDNTVYFATGDSHLYAIDALSGQQRWQVRLPGLVSMSSPALSGERLYVGTNDSLTAVDLDRRSIAWMFRDYGSFTDVPPAVTKGPNGHDLVVITAVKHADRVSREEKATYRTDPAKDHHFIYAFNDEGLLEWKDLLGFGPIQDDNTSGAPAIAGGVVYVGSPYTMSVFAYDVKTGKRVWERKVGAKVKGAPAIAGGRVYAGDTKGRLHVIDAATGEELKAVAVSDKPLAPAGPVIVDGTLFLSSQDGKVYALALADLDRTGS